MAKQYDFAKAKRIIEERKNEIEEALLGMYEDWAWTAETVFEDGKYSINLDTVKKIAGIDSSIWATPTLMLYLKDGGRECIPCYIGETEALGPQVPLMLGPLSAPVQASMPPLSNGE